MTPKTLDALLGVDPSTNPLNRGHELQAAIEARLTLALTEENWPAAQAWALILLAERVPRRGESIKTY
jgi:hypothetical protein